MRNRIQLVALAAFAAIALGAVFGLNHQSAVEAAQKVDAAKLYKEQCAKCHGAEGKGLPGLGTPNFADEKWQARRTNQALTKVIAEGAGIMPPYGEALKKTEITALVKHIRTFAKKGK